MSVKKRCYIERSNTYKLIEVLHYFLWRGSEETDIFLRPLALRLANTFRPLAEAIRSRNPCLLRRFLLEG